MKSKIKNGIHTEELVSHIFGARSEGRSYNHFSKGRIDDYYSVKPSILAATCIFAI